MRFCLGFLLALAAAAQSPEDRAIAYLEGEVLSWSRTNGCYSCHNNGDGARALYAAMNAGYAVSESALADTSRWLREPAGWDENKGDPGSSDKSLAVVQWAAAAAAAQRGGVGELGPAAEILARDQRPDGSWAGEAEGSVGSPVTWGRALTTATAVATLRSADEALYTQRIAAAQQWLRKVTPSNVPQAAALVFAFGEGEAADRGRRFIEDAQASDGGWGPYRNAPSEVFDTALAVLALTGDPQRAMQGRDYLLRTQLAAGGWLETTRPSGSQSYAQHISTTAWALRALLKTDGKRD